MERLAVQKVVEIMRHPPALYWGVSAAAALCWGTSAALAKRGKNNNRRNNPRNRNRANPSVAFKRLRRKYAEKLRPFFEDLVYLAMAILNNLVGIVYWLLDCCYEGRPNPVRNYFLIRDAVSRTIEPDSNASKISEEGYGGDVYKPRRGAIMRLRTRLVKINSLRGRPQTCGCWGWVVDDLPAAKLGDPGKECEVGADPEEFGSSNGCEMFETGVYVKQGCDEEFVEDLQVQSRLACTCVVRSILGGVSLYDLD